MNTKRLKLGIVPLLAGSLLCQTVTNLNTSSLRPEQKSVALEVPPDYSLGPGDQVTLWALGAEELSDKPLRIDPNGYLDVPLIGPVHASGMTLNQLRAEVEHDLRANVRDPHVSVNITEFRSQPVSVLGAVNHPGVYQLQGQKTLAEVLSMAEGSRNDAGNVITIRRRAESGAIPLPGAVTDVSERYSIAQVNMQAVMEGKAGSIYLRPGDVVTVPRSPLVYVLGEVHKPGGFVVGERDHISVLQALSMAEGLNRTAMPKKVQLLRKNGTATRTNINVDIARIMDGKQEDIALQPDDILVVPNNRVKNGMARIGEIAANAITGVAIYRVGMGY